MSNPPFQFRLSTLMLVTSILCLLFAVLGNMAVSPGEALFGFFVVMGIAGLAVVIVEFFPDAS